MHASKEEVPMAVDTGGVVIRLTEWGEMNVALESFPAGTDTEPIFKGLRRVTSALTRATRRSQPSWVYPSEL
jgi:hypothetical protein